MKPPIEETEEQFLARIDRFLEGISRFSKEEIIGEAQRWQESQRLINR